MSFVLAVNRPFANQQGEREADFIACIAWRKQAENLARYQKKGNLIGVTGRMQSRSDETAEGRTVFVMEVIAQQIQYLERKQGDSLSSEETHSEGNPVDIPEDDLPF